MSLGRLLKGQLTIVRVREIVTKVLSVAGLFSRADEPVL
jgi:hypothetical protein